MSAIDWLVLIVTLLSIVAYGVWKSRGSRNIESYLLADKQIPWYGVGLSVMATQASAITFLSAPGQAYGDGLRFVQFYFGLPLAMIVLCVTIIPIFHRMKVYTAYEYLEARFDNKTRTLTAALFLIQRGLSTGITIYAPAIILSGILHIDITYTTLFTGIAVILYTVYGGTKAVSYTQIFQMAIIFAGLLMAGIMLVRMLPPGVGFSDALHIAGKSGRTNAIVTKFHLKDKYNVWSGLIGGFFLQLSYFGTDQAQVGRYLTGKSIAQSRLGLIMNGLIKIPMQFFILLLGTLMFAFYQYHTPPLFFNPVEAARVSSGAYGSEYRLLEGDYARLQVRKQAAAQQLTAAVHIGDHTATSAGRTALQDANRQDTTIRAAAVKLIKKANPGAEGADSNYVFLTFVTTYLPAGMVGLLIAIIFLSAMGATASGLNALTSTTVVDFYKRFVRSTGSDSLYLSASRWATVGWGVFCIIVSLYAGRLGNLIEAVNILGSLFYGTILGIFLVAFYLKSVGGAAVFRAALVTEVIVVAVWLADVMAFLWLNVVGCVLMIVLSLLLQKVLPAKKPAL